MSRSLHAGTDPNCGLCHGQGYLVSAVDEQAVARPCTCLSTCPLCRGSGWVAVGDGNRAPRARCSCQRLTVRIQRFNEANFPARHAASTRASFKPSGKEHLSVVKTVAKYVQEFRPGEAQRGLVLHGDVGRGKTHLMIATARDLLFERGVSAKFVEFSHLLADLKSGFERGEGMGALIEPLVKVDVLLIDELGKGRNTEFEGTVLDELVSRRYNALRPILGTTNFAPARPTGRATANAALPETTQPTLADRVGPRVYSRLVEICDFCLVGGDDYRERTRAR